MFAHFPPLVHLARVVFRYFLRVLLVVAVVQRAGHNLGNQYMERSPAPAREDLLVKGEVALP